MQASQAGEKWLLGVDTVGVFIGVGLDWCQIKHFIFDEGDGLFVIKKNEFYREDTPRRRISPAPEADPTEAALKAALYLLGNDADRASIGEKPWGDNGANSVVQILRYTIAQLHHPYSDAKSDGDH